MRKSVVMVLIVSSLAGGCVTHSKPVGTVTGAVLTVAGMALTGSALSADCEPENAIEGLFVTPACQSAAATMAMFGTLTAVSGLTILIATLASSSPSVPGNREALSPLPAAPAPGTSPPAAPPRPDLPWPARPPSRSPSAPSGSPLAFD